MDPKMDQTIDKKNNAARSQANTKQHTTNNKKLTTTPHNTTQQTNNNNNNYTKQNHHTTKKRTTEQQNHDHTKHHIVSDFLALVSFTSFWICLDSDSVPTEAGSIFSLGLLLSFLALPPSLSCSPFPCLACLLSRLLARSLACLLACMLACLLAYLLARLQSRAAGCRRRRRRYPICMSKSKKIVPLSRFGGTRRHLDC